MAIETVTTQRRVWQIPPRGGSGPTKQDYIDAAANNCPEIQETGRVTTGTLYVETFITKDPIPAGTILTVDEAGLLAPSPLQISTSYGNIIPDQDLVYSLGEPTAAWAAICTNQLSVAENSNYLAIVTLDATMGSVPRIYITSNVDQADIIMDLSNLRIPGGKITEYDGVVVAGKGIPVIHDIKSLTNQSADIADTAFANASTSGLYRVSVYLVNTISAVTAGQVICNIKFNNGFANQTVAIGPVVLTTLGSFIQQTVLVRLGSGLLTYSVTHIGIYSTAKYTLDMSCEKLSS